MSSGGKLLSASVNAPVICKGGPGLSAPWTPFVEHTTRRVPVPLLGRCLRRKCRLRRFFYGGGRVPWNYNSQGRGALDEGTTSFRCRKQRTGPYRVRVVDAHGHALSKFAGVGHCGGKHHSAMEDALSDSARSAGISAVQKPRGIYVNNVGHRRRHGIRANAEVKE